MPIYRKLAGQLKHSDKHRNCYRIPRPMAVTIGLDQISLARGHLSKYLRVYTSPEWRFQHRSTEFDMVVALYRDHVAMEILKPFRVTGFEYHRGFDEMYAFDADGKIKGEVQ